MEALIHIEDKNNKVLDYIPQDSYWGEVRHRELKSNRDTFDFETFSDKPFSKYIEDQNRIIIPDKLTGFAEFIIDEHIEVLNNNDSHGLRVYTTASYLLLKKSKVINPYISQAQAATAHVGNVLQGIEEWKIGNIAYTGIRTLEIEEHTNPYDLLKRIASEFNLELQFRVVIKDDVITRYVDMVERVGAWRGYEVTLGHNLIGIERKSKSSDVVTALVGIGPADTEGNRKTVLVTNEDAKERWGVYGRHLIDVYYPESTDQNMTTERLTTLTENELEKRIAARVEYVSDFNTLAEKIGQQVFLGDTIRITDTKFNPPLYLEARVHTSEEGIKLNSPTKAVLGDYIEFTEAEVKSIFRLLQKEVAVKVSNAQLADYTYDKTAIDTKDQSTYEDGTLYSDQMKQQAISAAALDAQNKASAAQQAAEEYALAKAELAETQAKAHADGIVDAEEQARIDADIAKLAEAKEHAETKASEAQSAAEAYTRSQLTGYVNTTLYDNEMSAIQAQIDNQITSHFKNYAPSLTNLPASDWTTNAEKDTHIGDLFYNSSTGYSYRFMLDNTVYKWVLVRDEGIAKALQDAAQAQDTADSKRRVFVAQPTTPYDIGDLWANGNNVYRSTVTKTTSATFSSADWTKIGDVTSQNTSADTSKVAGVAASTIKDKANNSLQLGQSYNGSGFSNSEGLFSNRADGLVRVLGNADVGFVIQKRAVTTDPWEEAFYVDTNGILSAAGLAMKGGAYNSEVNQPVDMGDGTFTNMLYEILIEGATVKTKRTWDYNNTVYEVEMSGGNFYARIIDVIGEIETANLNASGLSFYEETTGRDYFSFSVFDDHTRIYQNGVYIGFFDSTGLFMNGKIDMQGGNIENVGQLIGDDFERTPSLQNGWVPYGSPYGPATYYKDAQGFVHLSGLVKGGVIGAYDPMFVLPAGYRPLNRIMFNVLGEASKTRVDVDANGSVSVTIGTNGYVTLNGIYFKQAR